MAEGNQAWLGGRGKLEMSFQEAKDLKGDKRGI